MSLDRLSLAAYFLEISPRVAGRRIEKVRTHGPSSLRLDLSSRETLFIDVSRALAGLWLLPRSSSLPADARVVEGPSRTAALLFKKHLEGARIESLGWAPSRDQRLETSRGFVDLRSSGDAAATFVGADGLRAHFGGGREVEWPAMSAPPIRTAEDWARLVTEVAEASREEARATLLAADAGLLPLLRHWPRTAPSRERLIAELAARESPQPYVVPAIGDDAANSEVPPALVPFEPESGSVAASTFLSAASDLYVALRRADLFRDERRSRLARAKSEVARMTRLRAALQRDRDRWPDPQALRHHAEALLASPEPESAIDRAAGLDQSLPITILDPRGGPSLTFRIDRRMTLPQNANAMYGRARNIERQREAFEARWTDLERRSAVAEASLQSLLATRSIEDLFGSVPESKAAAAPVAAEKKRVRFLTSRGLEMLVGRSAAENHELTFKEARREDLWFHVLDAPGGHVILRNRDGRANREDIAEAASVAAHVSERRTEGRVDVQYTERKHVNPAGGGKGRVRVAHAEVIRVAPCDPIGRFRSRS